MNHYKLYIRLSFVPEFRPIMQFKKDGPPEELTKLLPAAKSCLERVSIDLTCHHIDDDGNHQCENKKVRIQSVPYWQYDEEYNMFVAPIFEKVVPEDTDEEPLGIAVLRSIQ